MNGVRLREIHTLRETTKGRMNPPSQWCLCPIGPLPIFQGNKNGIESFRTKFYKASSIANLQSYSHATERRGADQEELQAGVLVRSGATREESQTLHGILQREGARDRGRSAQQLPTLVSFSLLRSLCSLAHGLPYKVPPTPFPIFLNS